MEPTQMELMLFAAGSRNCAKTSASPEKAQDLKEQGAASGLSTSASSKKRSRATPSLKTCQPFALADWKKCSGHSLRSGMMRNGIVYQLPPLAHLTKGTESGLWATPTTMDSMAPKTEKALLKEATVTRLGRTNWSNLRDHQVVRGKKMWPTPPTRQDACGRDRHNQKNGKVILSLLGEARKWPTPTTRDYKDGSAESCKNVPVNGLLGRAVHQEWPMPTANHRSGLQSHGCNAILGSLNPRWTEWLMGFPDGWTELKPSEMPSSRKSRKSSVKP